MTAKIATVSTAPPTLASRNARTFAPTDSPARLTTSHTTNGKHNAADAFNAIATAMSATPAKNPPNTAGYADWRTIKYKPTVTSPTIIASLCMPPTR